VSSQDQTASSLQPSPDAALATTHLAVRDLGRLAYAPALDAQRRLNQAVIDGAAPPTVLLVEHEPVITVSQRKRAREHLLASEDRLRKLGIAVAATDRGGDITYHGPGQLVAYPILKLSPVGLNLSRYMRWLEQVVIDTLAAWSIDGRTESGATGVWVDRASEHASNDQRKPVPAAASAPRAKICAMGVRIRKNTTMHGLALNVAPDLSHFDTIVPCGLSGRSVTSLAALLGDEAPSMAVVKARLVQQLDAAYGRLLHRGD
jgi:lipoyl(octanoyl) transferase